MTREEAIDLVIKVFDTLEGECNIEYDWSKEHNARDMAIKALEQEPCEDTVSRAEVVDELNRLGRNAFKDDTDYDNFFAFLDSLPSVTPTQRWIPVSEKLPEPFTFVNATCRSLVDDRENWVVETVYLPIPKEVNKHGYSDWGNIPMLNWGEAEVIAWVERIIPQPYKAESE